MPSILYIEDNVTNRKLLEAFLNHQRPDIDVSCAESGEEGLAMMQESPPDLLFLDIHLPGLNGYEVYDELKTSEKTRHIPVVALSANAMKKDVEKGLQAGFVEYLTKPFEFDQVLALLDRLLPKE